MWSQFPLCVLNVWELHSQTENVGAVIGQKLCNPEFVGPDEPATFTFVCQVVENLSWHPGTEASMLSAFAVKTTPSCSMLGSCNSNLVRLAKIIKSIAGNVELMAWPGDGL